MELYDSYYYDIRGLSVFGSFPRRFSAPAILSVTELWSAISWNPHRLSWSKDERIEKLPKCFLYPLLQPEQPDSIRGRVSRLPFGNGFATRLHSFRSQDTALRYDSGWISGLGCRTARTIPRFTIYLNDQPERASCIDLKISHHVNLPEDAEIPQAVANGVNKTRASIREVYLQLNFW